MSEYSRTPVGHARPDGGLPFCGELAYIGLGGGYRSFSRISVVGSKPSDS